MKSEPIVLTTPTSLEVIKVAIVEDAMDIRESLRVLINGSEGFRCVGSYFSGEETLEKVERQLPDVILMDIGLPKMSGIEVIQQLKIRHPKILFLILTVYDDDTRIFNSLCAGASGYLLKKTQPAKLLEGITEAINGGAPMTPEIAHRVIEFFTRQRPMNSSECHLTPHEIRLLKLLAEGHSYRSSASILGVTTHTVSFHLRNIYEKMHVHSKSEAIAKALRDHLID